jgi:hypothetical protein
VEGGSVTPGEYRAIEARCRRFWGTVLRGSLSDHHFQDFVQAACMSMLEDGEQGLGNACRTALWYLRRAEEKQADIRAHAVFEASGCALPSHVDVPFRTWGGARSNSGGARKGAGRPRKSAA